MVSLPVRLEAAYKSQAVVDELLTAFDSPTLTGMTTRRKKDLRSSQNNSPDDDSVQDEETTPAISEEVTATISQRLAIYNDHIPASSQPQTPEHVPEARHQSRYHPSYTAPVRRNLYWRYRRADTMDEGRVAEADRSARSPGFDGLYGGQENDEFREYS